MAASVSPHRQGMKIRQRALLCLYPNLRDAPPESWQSLLGEAREAELETAEWMAVVGAVALVAWLLETPAPADQAFIGHVLQYLLALPLLAALIGPIHLRRTRRGLGRELARRKDSRQTPMAQSSRMEA